MSSKDIEFKIERGVEKLDTKDYEDAIEIFDQILRKEAKNTEANYLKGLALLDLGKFNEAIISFDKVLEIDSNNADALYFKGNCLFELEDYEGALKNFEKSLQINPDDAEVWNDKGSTLENLGKHEDALKSYDKALEIDPNFALPWFNKGIYYHDNLERDEARKYFEQAILIDPEEPDYWLYKGRTLILDDDDEALKCFEKALELDPDLSDALSDKGFLLYAKGELRKALNSFNEALKINPRDSFALEQKGFVLIDLEKYDEAIATFEKILEIDVGDVNAQFNKGYTLLLKDEYEKALNCFEKVLEIDQGMAEAWNYLGEALVNLGNKKEALYSYNKALEINPELEIAWINKGLICRHARKHEEALKCFETLLAMNQDYAEAWYQKGNVLTDLNRKKESLESYQKFVDLVESKKIEYWKLTAARIEEFIAKQKSKGTEIIVSPRKEPWYWQWSTKAEYFLEPNGEERKDLEPGAISHPGDWWTCHKDTRAGDLILLYRAGKKGGKRFQDIKYLILATSDAYSITDDEYAFEHGWTYGCDYDVLFKFKNPLTLNDIREEPFLDDWNAFRGLFHLSAYKTEPRHWNKINELLTEKNPDYKTFLEKPTTKEKIKRIKSELELEDALFQEIKVLKKFGLDLEVVGRQVICKGEGGFMDILCRDNVDDSYVVIELKIVPADQSAFAQISYYVAWVEERMAKGKPVRGIVISKGQDNRFKLAVNRDPHIQQIELSEVLSELGMNLT